MPARFRIASAGQDACIIRPVATVWLTMNPEDPREMPDPSRISRTVDHSRVQMTEIILPEDTNPRGSVFGGRVLALIDKCAAVCAIRHARHEVVTVSLDSVVFLSKVQVGDILALGGRLNAVFGSSMEIEVEVHSESPATGDRKLTTRALVTMVAVDDDGRPRKAPALELLSDPQRQRAEQAAERRRIRLAARSS
jgi:acyl-CoA hydrolase